MTEDELELELELELRALIANSAIVQARADESITRLEACQEKSDAQMTQTDKLLNRLAVMYGGVSNNQGAERRCHGATA